MAQLQIARKSNYLRNLILAFALVMLCASSAYAGGASSEPATPPPPPPVGVEGLCLAPIPIGQEGNNPAVTADDPVVGCIYPGICENYTVTQDDLDAGLEARRTRCISRVYSGRNCHCRWDATN